MTNSFFAPLSLFYLCALATFSSAAVVDSQPFISSPGDAAILVFLDIHTSYHDNVCSDPDWSALELAYRLYWNGLTTNATGIEVYDTCGSYRRVSAILQSRVANVQCNASDTPTPISGVISYSTKEVNDIITSAVDAVHVVIRDGSDVTSGTALADDQIYADIMSYSNIEVLSAALVAFQWTYISTFADDHTVAQTEHTAFLQAAQTNHICVQYSEIVSNWSEREAVDIKTPGVVVFDDDLSDLDLVMHELSNTSAVFIVTHDRRTEAYKYIHNGIVLSDTYTFDADFSEYMLPQYKNQSVDSLIVAYFLARFNCTLNQTTLAVSCSGEEDMRAHFYAMTSSRVTHVFDGVFGLLSQIGQAMVDVNCTDFHRSCLTDEMFSSSEIFQGIDNQTLKFRPKYNSGLTYINGGNIIKADEFSSVNMNTITQEMLTLLGSTSFPESTCTDWCPDCQSSMCSLASMTRKPDFDGDFIYIPGDVLIAGMVPMSAQWDKGADATKTCSGVRVADNVDILSEAFVYAVQSAKTRYPGIFGNATVGALLFDTCMDANRASQIMVNFESCKYQLKPYKNNWRPLPSIVPVYVVLDRGDHGKAIVSEAAGLVKLAIGVDQHGSIYDNNGVIYDASTYDYDVVAAMLKGMDWTYVGVLSSTDIKVDLSALYDSTNLKNICISYHSKISSRAADLATAFTTVKSSVASVVILIAKSDDVDSLFRYWNSKSLVRTWIIMESRQQWFNYEKHSSVLPLGTIIIQWHGKQNDAFNSHINTWYSGNSAGKYYTNSWLETYRDARLSSNVNAPIGDVTTLMQASDVIKTVDVSLAVVNAAENTLCDVTSDFCGRFLIEGVNQTFKELANVTFNYQEEQIRLAPHKMMINYVVTNLHDTGFVEVGYWVNSSLLMSTTKKIRSYDSVGDQLASVRESVCYSDTCICFNVNSTNTTTDNTDIQALGLDPEMGFVDSSAKFESDLWKIIVVIIAGSGGLLTLLLMVYILCKVCSGSLIRRYLVIGIPMLFAMVFLFLSVLPFVFTPSETVCGMRYFAHGFSYALCFATLFTKMMSMRDHSLVGLGGNTSRMNSLLCVFFITGVQIAIGVQWWVLKKSMLITETAISQERGELLQKTYYACDFQRNDFIAYHSYVILLIVLCCIYSLSLKVEDKNMKEVSTRRVLIICSWFCLLLWIAIIVTFFVLDRKYLEAICAIGLLANALSVLVIIFLPTVTAISRLSYNVADQTSRKENGYKLDPDFQFERPYSLPGTLHSAITDKNLTYPRSLATFDTSLSY